MDCGVSGVTARVLGTAWASCVMAYSGLIAQVVSWLKLYDLTVSCLGILVGSQLLQFANGRKKR